MHSASPGKQVVSGFFLICGEKESEVVKEKEAKKVLCLCSYRGIHYVRTDRHQLDSAVKG